MRTSSEDHLEVFLRSRAAMSLGMGTEDVRRTSRRPESCQWAGARFELPTGELNMFKMK